MKTLMEEFLRTGAISPYCKDCIHFLAGKEPRTVMTPERLWHSSYPLKTPPVKFVPTYKSTPVCNECFYHNDGTPSNFTKRGVE